MGKIIKNGIVFGGGSSDWTGKSSEVNIAIDNGEITEGMTVNITDDNDANSTFFDEIKEYIDNNTINILNSMEEVNSSKSEEDVAGASVVKNLNDSVTTLNNSLSSMFKIQQWTTGYFNIGANSDKSINVNVALSGYTPLGVIRWANGGLSQFYCYNMAVNANTNIANLAFHSTYSANFSNAQFHFTVLYVKNIFA